MSSAVTLRALTQQVSAAISATKDLAVGTFAIGGEIPIEQPQAEKNEDKVKVPSAPVVLRWDNPSDHPGPNRVSFPITSDVDARGFDHLLKVSEKATFGLNGRHEFDETYRKAQKLGADDFCTTFSPYETGIVDVVSQVLLPSIQTAEDSRSIRAELYNMNIYSGPSGKFKAHVDTPRSSYQIGSLVVCLPMNHEGGELAVRHDERTEAFDWAKKSGESSIQWAAFYSDSTPGNGALAGQPSAFNPASLSLYSQVKAMVTSEKFRAKHRIFGVYSTHAYPHTEEEHGLPFCLKGIDMALYEIFTSLGLEVHLCAILERPMHSWRETALDDGEFSDGEDVDTVTDSRSETESDHSSEEDDYYDPERVVGHIARLYASDCTVDDEGRTTVQELIECTIGSGWDKEKIVWLNKNNGESRLQVSYVAYGNEPSSGQIYSYFAMVVEVPRKRAIDGDDKATHKRVRED
ncbi:hypothetical protein CGGC5_v012902 [Colletotrichum fructicola Nara gc5]|uniref:Uncharacterized protein n=1 Tax=Colletotrichum fructicola (strain Nara gc5) TaxID=1213859 RepID=A0A7J6IQA9_COLFN|nr:hypothetical protein CFRS1_v001440 [Colletotrichum fructicola]KAF4479094.1 hypothetical protein CGGC5_v012902 [Colletotrichum fructicola Nara gc5]